MVGLQCKFNERFVLLMFILCSFPLCVSESVLGQANISFNVAPRHPIGLNTVDIVYHDIDGDGFLDAAAVNGGQGNPSPSLTIKFGQSGGGFDAPLVLPTLTIGQTLAAGDLNHDGRTDIVIGSWYHNRLAVFLNHGNRQFGSPWFTAPPDPPYGGNPTTTVGEFFDLAIADFDGDGFNDVVAVQDQVNQRLRFFHFSGQGLLTPFATIDQLGNETSYERKIAVGDISGDGRPDVVFAGGGPGIRTFSFVLGQQNGGTLSLVHGFNVEDRAVGISLRDIDIDGDLDMTVAFLDTTTPTRHSLQVFRNIGGAQFSPLPKNFLEYPFPPNDITTNDFNGDGAIDIAALVGSVHSSGLMVLVMHGRNNGTFSKGIYYATSTSSSIFSSDFDYDGKIDIVTASSLLDQTDYSDDGNTVSILFNNNLRGFEAPQVSLWGPNFIDAGDFNDDGFHDMVSSWATYFNATSGVDILINDTSGGLIPEVHHPSPAALSGMKAGDFNGDGKCDAVSAHEDNARLLALYLGDGSGSLASPRITSFQRGLLNVVVGEFNSDNNDDVLVLDDSGLSHVLLGNSNGVFSIAPGSPFSMPSSTQNVSQIGDFNQDGNEDLVLGGSSQNRLWLGNGTGSFNQTSAVLPATIIHTVGDFNGDGKLDIAGTIGAGIVGALGNGNGGFGPEFYRPIVGTYSINLAASIISADFDRNGSDEVVLTMSDNYNGNLILMQFDSLTPSPTWKSPIFYGVGPATRAYGGMLIAKDFNSDGKPDIGYLGDNARGIIYNTTPISKVNQFDFDGDSKTDIGIYRPNGGSGAEWWLQRSSNGSSFAVQFGAPTDKVAAADYTGDGKTDVAFWRPSNGFWYVLRSEDLTFYAFPFGANGDVPVPSDYDADGKADVGVFRPADSTWYIQRSGDGGTTIQQFGVNGDVPVNADYDGDGKADIAIYRPSLGQWWLMRSTAGTIAYTFGAPTDKTVVGDYTGDGKADVAFWRPSTGEWYVLRSEDTSFFAFPFGVSLDTPVPGDYDGDGRNDAGVFRSSNNTWYIQRSTAGTLIQQFGTSGDLPLPNAYVR